MEKKWSYCTDCIDRFWAYPYLGIHAAVHLLLVKYTGCSTVQVRVRMSV